MRIEFEVNLIGLCDLDYKLFKAKAFAEDSVHDLDGHVEERPAPVADVGALAARADLVVRVHINIEDELALGRGEGDGLGVLAWRAREDGPDLDTRGVLGGDRLLHLLRGPEAEVPHKHAVLPVHLDAAGELAPREDAGVVVRKPPVHEVEREEL